jgi:hypothetical protein
VFSMDSLRRRFLDRLDDQLARLVFALVPARRAGGGKAAGMLRVFTVAECLLQRGHAITPVRPGGFLRYEVTPFPSGRRPLPCSPPVEPGDPVLVLHFDNQALADVWATNVAAARMTWRLYTRMVDDLRVLASMMCDGKVGNGVGAVWCETVLYEVMARIGFDTRPGACTVRRPFARLYFLSLMAVYGPVGNAGRASAQLRRYRLGEAWLDRDTFVKRFAAKMGSS